MVRALVDKGWADPSQVYLVGFSQGGYLTYDLAPRHPDIFRGAVSVGGWLEPDRLAGPAAPAGKLHLLVLRSGTDQAVLWSEAGAATSFLRKQGVPYALETFEGGHAFTPAVADKVPSWLAKELAGRSPAATRLSGARPRHPSRHPSGRRASRRR